MNEKEGQVREEENSQRISDKDRDRDKKSYKENRSLVEIL